MTDSSICIDKTKIFKILQDHKKSKNKPIPISEKNSSISPEHDQSNKITCFCNKIAPNTNSSKNNEVCYQCFIYKEKIQFLERQHMQYNDLITYVRNQISNFDQKKLFTDFANMIILSFENESVLDLTKTIEDFTNKIDVSITKIVDRFNQFSYYKIASNFFEQFSKIQINENDWKEKIENQQNGYDEIYKKLCLSKVQSSHKLRDDFSDFKQNIKELSNILEKSPEPILESESTIMISNLSTERCQQKVRDQSSTKLKKLARNQKETSFTKLKNIFDNESFYSSSKLTTKRKPVNLSDLQKKSEYGIFQNKKLSFLKTNAPGSSSMRVQKNSLAKSYNSNTSLTKLKEISSKKHLLFGYRSSLKNIVEKSPKKNSDLYKSGSVSGQRNNNTRDFTDRTMKKMFNYKKIPQLKSTIENIKTNYEALNPEKSDVNQSGCNYNTNFTDKYNSNEPNAKTDAEFSDELKMDKNMYSVGSTKISSFNQFTNSGNEDKKKFTSIEASPNAFQEKFKDTSNNFKNTLTLTNQKNILKKVDFEKKLQENDCSDYRKLLQDVDEKIQLSNSEKTKLRDEISQIRQTVVEKKKKLVEDQNENTSLKMQLSIMSPLTPGFFDDLRNISEN